MTQSVKKPTQIADAAWAFDLATQGYAPDPGAAFRAQIPTLRDVNFIDENIVVATFTERVTSTGLHRRDDPNRVAPFKLHAIFLDAASGKVLRTQAWNSDASEIGIVPGAEGTYAVYEGNIVYKFERDGTPMQTLRIPSAEGPGVGIWALSVSPTGKTMLAQYRSDAGVQCEWIRTDTMTTNGQSCQIPENASISDNLIAAHEARKKQTDPNKIYISKLGGEWKPICTSEDASGCAAVNFAGEDSLLAYNAGKLEFMHTDGKRIFQQDLDQKIEVAVPYSAISAGRNGERVAILLWNSPFSNSAIRQPGSGPNGETGVTLTPRRIVVVDLAAKRWIFSLEIKNQQPTRLDFALSPNGDALAVKIDGIVRFFRIGEPTQ